MQKAIYHHLTPKGGGGGRLAKATKGGAKPVPKRPKNFVGDKVLLTDLIIMYARKAGYLLPKETKPRVRGHRCRDIGHVEELLRNAARACSAQALTPAATQAGPAPADHSAAGEPTLAADQGAERLCPADTAPLYRR